MMYFGYSILLEWPDMKKMMQATMTMSIGVQVLARFNLYFLEPVTAPKCHELVVKFFESCDNFDQKRKKLLATYTRRLRFLFKVILALHAFCQFFPFCMSFFNFVVSGKTVPPIPAFAPFIDRHSIAGYFFNIFLQLVISVELYLGNPAGDCTYVLIVTHLKPRVDMLGCDLKDFEKFLSVNKEKLDENKEVIKGKLTNLINRHREILEFHEIFEVFISKQFFVLITINIYVICSSGISLLTSDYSIAIGIAILYPIQIFFVCTMGSFVRHQHQRLNQFLWEFKWYQLPVCYQKNYLFFMLNAQKPINLELLFIGVIDMELYTNVRKFYYEIQEFLASLLSQVINLIYSYFMIMWNMLED